MPEVQTRHLKSGMVVKTVSSTWPDGKRFVCRALPSQVAGVLGPRVDSIEDRVVAYTERIDPKPGQRFSRDAASTIVTFRDGTTTIACPTSDWTVS